MTAATNPTNSGEAAADTTTDGADPAPIRPAPAAWMRKFGTGIAAAMPMNRSALLAGGLGFAAGVGLLVGAIGVMGVGYLFAAPTPAGAPAPWSEAARETRALKQTVTRLEAQVAGLKASIDTSNKNASTQRANIAGRDQRSARSQAEMQARIAKIGDTVERLEKRVAAAVAADTTGSVAPRYAAAAAAAQPQPQPPAAEAKPPEPPVLAGWVIRDVFRGRALVASRSGVFEAAPGLHLPGLGRVEAVTRQDGHWVVKTEKGIITALRRPRSARGHQTD